MVTLLPVLSACVPAVVTLGGGDASVGGDVWDPDAILEVRIELTDEAIDALNADGRSWVEGDVTIEGERFDDVGVRLKGSSTYQDFTGKPAFKVDLDKYVDGQAFRGVSALTLNNMVSDASQSREVIGYRLWADAGVFAPRCGYARVYVNDELFGLYASVEPMNEAWVDARYDDPDGDLWEGNDSADLNPAGLAHFENKCGPEDADRLAAIADAVQSAGDAFYDDVDGDVDMDQFLEFWAWSIAIGNRDGYPYHLNDFFVYVDPSDDRARFSPWGMDESWDTGTPSGWTYVAGDVAEGCLGDDACADRLSRATADAIAFYEDEDVLTLAEAAWDLSQDDVLDDPKRPYTPQEVDQARDELGGRIVAYPDRVRDGMGL